MFYICSMARINSIASVRLRLSYLSRMTSSTRTPRHCPSRFSPPLSASSLNWGCVSFLTIPLRSMMMQQVRLSLSLSITGLNSDFGSGSDLQRTRKPSSCTARHPQSARTPSSSRNSRGTSSSASQVLQQNMSDLLVLTLYWTTGNSAPILQNW